MALYTNHSRQAAIVTVLVQSTENPNKALKKGAKSSFEDLEADPGCHDFIVESGQSLDVGPNTMVSVLSVRSSL